MSDHAENSSRHHRVLAVDDNMHNLEIMREMLSEDYIVETAPNGEACLAMIGEFRPSVVLLDIMMPGINGYEVCKRLRALPEHRHVKIIMVSAKTSLSERLQGYESGADDYLTKPFEEDELLAKVSVYLRLKSVEEVDQLKTELLMLLSHETRTPLSSIVFPAEMLAADGPVSDEERRMYGEMIRDSAMHLSDMFEKIVKLCSMKSGKYLFQFDEVSLAELAQSAVDSVSAEYDAKGVSLLLDLEGAGVGRFDRTEIEMLIGTLLENALEHSASGTEVRLEASVEGQRVALSVTDQGEGIAPEEQRVVFHEFDGSDVQHHQSGSGLSLAIAKYVAQFHDGELTLTSPESGGACFTLSLPLVQLPTLA